ncbi:UbiH/UbiF family hydroxylase [Amantichitinum ursilacus]|uniref:2-octaprenylphenol hydroxylase n=1 Tax=Amantichitinum ursilacus TaxID=857265 RepID=A0A0N0GNR6_9NEIS|nr:UbiH/UbiF family hydroxylase [Amantichitinum ursilacus]KPC53094.1 2-octaprenylphenol hydroxylase [Amantichitinum ursilacus]
MKIHDCDVLIIGGGLVGAALACALRDTALSVMVLEGRAPEIEWDAASWDSRIYAISPASRRFLTGIGAWQQLDAARTQRVGQMLITGDDRRARLDFDATAAGADELARIVESRELQRALWQTAATAPNVQLLAGVKPTGMQFDQADATITLDDGRCLSSRLVVGADGVQSWVRQQVGIDAQVRPYQQWGVVANFECAKPHLGMARQWFFDDGILAWLPLPGNRISMVWSCNDATRAELLALDAAALCERVATAGDNALGALQLLTPAAAFPLRLVHVSELVRPNLALVGDAAHGVHPLAGQGVNLGFGDVEQLARVLKAEPSARCGDLMVLRRYARARRESIYLMQGVTHALQHLFNNQNSLLKPLRNFGLGLTDQLTWLKQQLIRHAMDS